MRMPGEQRGCGHHLSRLAVPALRYVFGDPRALDWMRAVWRQPFDGSDPAVPNGRDRSHAGPRCHIIQVDGTRAALRDAAAELGSSQSQRVTQHPEERHVGWDVDGGGMAI